MEKNDIEQVNRDFKGVWIPKEIWISKDLTIIEKLFLVEIDSLDNENHCFASNGYFSSFFDISKSRCSQIINSLAHKKYITIDYLYEGKEIKKRIIKVLNKINGGIKNSNKGIKNIKGGYLENAKDNNTLINNTINISNKDYSEDFESLWKNYPRKENKALAYKKYLAMCKKHTKTKVFEFTKTWIIDFKNKNKDTTYCKHMATFLNQETFLDSEFINLNKPKLNKNQIAG